MRAKTYKSVLEEQDSRELHKAIGLAAMRGYWVVCVFQANF